VKAAAHRLGRLELRSREARNRVAWVAESLRDVSLAAFPSGAVPEVGFDRLNQHYRGVAALARLVLRHGAFEAGRGKVRASGFLMDMNQVFQEFVTVALRECLELSEHRFRSDDRLSGDYRLHLDEADHVGLRPHLSWWDDRICTFVGDAKYKRTKAERAPNADLYQMLAYATALDLPGRLLIYAEGDPEGGPASYRARHAAKHLHVATLDLGGPIARLKGEIGALAAQVRGLRFLKWMVDAVIALLLAGFTVADSEAATQGQEDSSTLTARRTKTSVHRGRTWRAPESSRHC